MAVLCLLVFASSARAAHPNIDVGCARAVTAGQAVGPAEAVWSPSRWKRLDGPGRAAVRANRRRVHCAKGLGHRAAIRETWRLLRSRFHRHQRKMLAAWNIDHRWSPHWAPDYSGPTLPPYVIAALAEKAGDALGNVPGWTMEQITIGESGRRPGSAGVDAGGTWGVCLWAITYPFANDIVAPLGGYYALWNPVKCAAAMVGVYARQGLGAWYGDGYVTRRDAHYRGRFDLRLVLGGVSFRRALRRDSVTAAERLAARIAFHREDPADP